MLLVINLCEISCATSGIVEVNVKLGGVDESMYISGAGLLLKMRGQFSVPIT